MKTLMKTHDKSEILKLKLQKVNEALEAIRAVNRIASGNELRVDGELELWREAYNAVCELKHRVNQELKNLN